MAGDDLPGRADDLAVVLSVSEFQLAHAGTDSEEDDEEDPPERSTWDKLEFAEHLGELVAERLAGVLAGPPDHLHNPDYSTVAGRMDRLLSDIRDGGDAIVHVLSHGLILPVPNELCVVAKDSLPSDHRDVDDTVFGITRFLTKAHKCSGRILLLLDVCHSGVGIDPTTAITFPDRRAFVIAACPSKEQAWGGRFSQAVSDVLKGLAQGHSEIHPSERFVRLTWFKDAVHKRVEQLSTDAGHPVQEVVASDLHGLVTEFLPNPWFREDLSAVMKLKNYWDLQDFIVGSVDSSLDVDHYMSRASGRDTAQQAQLTCHFKGREAELERIRAWLEKGAEEGATLCVVTGSPGAGKSALLGVVVCCAHPQLVKGLRPVMQSIPTKLRPNPRSRVAAVHARGMALSQVVDAVAAQLDLPLPPEGWTTQKLVDAVAGLVEEPLIVVDALDEAMESVQIAVELLLPLVNREDRGGGRRRACQLLVGVRPYWDKFPRLAEAVGDARQSLVNLDAVDRAGLREALTDYIDEMLGDTDTYLTRGEERGKVAQGAAERIERHAEGGEFLKAQLSVRYLEAAAPVTEEERERALNRLPLTFAALLETQLSEERTHPWARPVLAALAFSAGSGMPADRIADVAPEFHPWKAQPTRADVRSALDHVSFYLRRDVDPTYGTTLYRLYHQELVDHLRRHPRGGPGLLSGSHAGRLEGGSGAGTVTAS
ncbi:AAA family ATPase [[Kitasatospora] papulosa]|uniref:AAA family ATPase n=1 Tax=[Kitasatospora] papulosa TaxID=1464011 RepID=UPI003865E60F